MCKSTGRQFISRFFVLPRMKPGSAQIARQRLERDLRQQAAERNRLAHLCETRTSTRMLLQALLAEEIVPTQG